MTISYPIDPSRSAFFRQQPRDWDILLSMGNSYRALSGAVVSLVHAEGDLWVPPTWAGDVDGLLVASVDPQGSDGLGTVLRRHCEVRSDAIRYGDLDVAETNLRLREIGIVVRESAPVITW